MRFGEKGSTLGDKEKIAKVNAKIRYSRFTFFESFSVIAIIAASRHEIFKELKFVVIFVR
jgi:hypothetical protein